MQAATVSLGRAAMYRPRSRVLASPPALWLLTLPFWLASLSSLPVDLHVGPVSIFGVLSIVELMVFGVAAVICWPYPRFVVRRFIPIGGFLAWALVRSAAGIGFAGVQNLIVYLMFGCSILVAANVVRANPTASARGLHRGVVWMDFAVLPAILWMFFRYGIPLDVDAWPVQPRAVAGLATCVLAWHVAEWRSGDWRSAIKAFVWLAIIAATMSRTATVVAAMLTALVLVLRFRLTARRVFSTVAVVAGFLIALEAAGSYTSALSDRFFAGDTSIEIGGTAINAMGRLDIWEAVIDSALTHPILGGGLGSSEELLIPFGEHVNHPHNDYLRVWHDLGVPGVFFFLWALFDWFVVLVVASFGRTTASPVLRLVSFAALMWLAAVAAGACTDNPIIWAPNMGIGGVTLGAAFGLLVGRPRTFGREGHER